MKVFKVIKPTLRTLFEFNYSKHSNDQLSVTFFFFFFLFSEMGSAADP